MQWIGIETTEMQSERFYALCEHLEKNAKDGDPPLDRHKVLGHLMAWYFHWAADMGHDSGLLWNVKPARMGSWAGHPRPEHFGNALVAAGYCERIEDVYPEQLLAGRTGYCVRGSLDTSWNGIHGKRVSQRAELALFLLDVKDRAHFAAMHGSDLSNAPPGWLPDRHRGGTVAEADGQRGGDEPPAPPGPHVSGERPENTQQRNDVKGGRSGRSTAKPKTPAQLELIREFKYSDPLRCLIALDDTPYVQQRWQRICRLDPELVRTLLSNATETDEAWAKLRNPCAVIFNRVLARLEEIDNGRNGNGQRGGRGGRA